MARIGKREREALRADARTADTVRLMAHVRTLKRDTVQRAFRLTGGDADPSMPSMRRPKVTDARELARGQRQLDARERAAGFGGVRGRVTVPE